MTETFPDIVRHAESANESVRALDRLVGRVVSAPTAYDVLGNLKGVGNMLPQTLTQIAAGLGNALDELDTYEDDGGPSAARTIRSQKHLMRAAELADQLGDELEAAQTAISHQAHRLPKFP